MLTDGTVALREWADGADAAWYAESTRDPEIQRFTTDPPTLDAAQVLAGIARLRQAETEAGFVICDTVTGERLGNIALLHDGKTGEMSYWIAAAGRGRGAASRALALFSASSFETLGLSELWLCAHEENIGSQKTALRAGYQRDPGRDKTQEAKGAVWPMLGYTLTRP
jgi:RimJ/RimL family protein N-acetyltransferase